MLELKGIRWSLYQGALVPDEAPHKEVSLPDQDRRYLLRRSGAYLLRWTTHWDCQERTEFWHVIKDQPSRLEDYLSNTRRYTKRGLRLFGVEKVDPGNTADEAYKVYLQAFDRYNTRSKPESFDEFKRGFQDPRPGTEVWAAYQGHQMAAYAINRVWDGTCQYAAMKYNPAYLADACSFALIHTMNHHYLDVLRLRYITDGTRSLSHATKIQEFLEEHFGFRKAFCRLHLAYAPRVACAVQVLFPVRRLVYRVGTGWSEKLSVLLRHEEISRSFASSRLGNP